jgi:hypothetical protein
MFCDPLTKKVLMKVGLAMWKSLVAWLLPPTNSELRKSSQRPFRLLMAFLALVYHLPIGNRNWKSRKKRIELFCS